MTNVLLIGIGGGLGAVARYAVNHVTVTQLGSSLAGTFIANISGTFLLGLLVGLISSNPGWAPEIRLFLAVGFLASYTTFSTLSVATIQSLEKGDLLAALVNLVSSVLVGLVAAVGGMMLGRAI